MTLPPDPFDGRISQDVLSEYRGDLLVPILDETQPMRRRNRKMPLSVIVAAAAGDTSARRHEAVFTFESTDGDPVLVDTQDDMFFPFACQIEQVVLLLDQSATVEVDVWLTAFAGFDTISDTDSIASAALPSVTAGKSSSDVSLTNWTKDIPAQSTMRCRVTANDNARRIKLFIVVVEV